MASTDVDKSTAQQLTFWTITAMVVGSMVGAGVFSLPARFGQETGVAGALIAWLIAGTGMLMLAFVFQSLALRKPDLDAGVYAYAKAGFGEYVGFFSAFGYWASACVGNVTYWVLIMSTVGAIAPALGDGDTVLALALSTVGVWLFYTLIRRGVKDAAILNRIVTVAKVIPILVFIVLALFALDPQVFADNWSGNDDVGSLYDQVTGTMLVTVFVFLGVEGASVYSRHAQRREDVGRGTILGFLAVFSIFASVTIVSYGILPYSEIADLRQPSMGGVLEEAVGEWGKVFVGVGLIISVLGAYLAWTLMAAEVLYVAAQDDDMPRPRPGAPALDDPCPGHAGRGDVLRRRVQLRARPDQCADPDSVPVRRRVRTQAGAHQGDVHREPSRTSSRAGDGCARHHLHGVPAVRGGSEVHPVVVHHLRAGDDPVRHGSPRARQATVLATRADHPGRLGRRSGGRRRRSRHRRHRDLTPCRRTRTESSTKGRP
jgi:arginine:ornithine antiporter / lysine permease